MTDDRTARSDDKPIDAEIRSAIDHAETTVPATTIEDLVTAARAARDRSEARHRRTVRVTVGAAAVLVLVVAGVAIAVNRRSGDSTLIAGQRSVTANDSGQKATVLVDPSRGLVDAQVVTITVADGAFDAGTPVSAMQCTSSSLAMPGCQAGTRTSLGTMPTDGSDVSGPITVAAELDQLAPFHFDARTDSWTPDPTAGAMAPASCVATKGRTWTRVDGSGIGPDDGLGESGTAGETGRFDAGTGIPPTTMSDDDPGFATPCMIAVFGLLHGRPHVEGFPISFADPSTAPDGPGSDDTETGGPVRPVGPGTTAPSTTTPSGIDVTSCPTEAEWLTFTGDTGPSGPLVDTTPKGILVCTYRYTGGVADAVGGRLITDPARITAIVHALNSLQVPDPDQGCTADAGRPIALVMNPGDHGQLVWVEGFGCGFAHNGARVRDGARSVLSLLG